MKKLNSLFNITISYKTIWILLVCILALLLFPMLYISKFNIPSADDYSYGLLAHNIVENGGTIADVFKTMIDQFRYFYENWQGTFSCVFLALFQPAAFGEQYYIIVPYMILLSLIPGIFFSRNHILQLFFRQKNYHSNYRLYNINNLYAISANSGRGILLV